MTKTFCDRCGREITTDREYGWLSHRVKYSTISFWAPHHKDKWTHDDDKYLCPQCEEEFVQWYEKGVN